MPQGDRAPEADPLVPLLSCPAGAPITDMDQTLVTNYLTSESRNIQRRSSAEDFDG